MRRLKFTVLKSKEEEEKQEKDHKSQKCQVEKGFARNFMGIRRKVD
jgi:hypothetical protein